MGRKDSRNVTLIEPGPENERPTTNKRLSPRMIIHLMLKHVNL
jgi:hypothetical protein